MGSGERGTADGVARTDGIRIPVGDETVGATRYEPAADSGPYPTVVMYAPYHTEDLITFGFYNSLHRYLAQKGYAVLIADMVGSGSSSGAMDDWFGQHEGKNGAQLVEWAGRQEWSTGSVGMIGLSWGGITALYTAAEQPESLDAIVPIHTPYRGYGNGYISGGVFKFNEIGMRWLTLMQALDVKPPSRRDSDGRWARIWEEHLDCVEQRTPPLFEFVANESKSDEYWRHKDIDVGRIETPTLAVGGWRDNYVQAAVEYFEAIPAEKRLLLGPWRHTMPHQGREAAINFRHQAVEWFDRFLRDEPADTRSWPQITYWTERDGGGKVETGTWRGTDSWPTVGSHSTETVTFAASPAGLVPPETFTDGRVVESYQDDQTVGIESTDYGAPADTTPDDSRSLVFETDPLSEPVELTGSGQATVRLTPATADPLVTVRIVDVAPDGTGTLVTHGTMRPSYRSGPSEKQELTPGTEYGLTIPLEPRSHLFESDHVVRVALSGAFFPKYLPTSDQGSFELLSSPSQPAVLEFPGSTGVSELDDSVRMPGPDENYSLASPYKHSDPKAWTVARSQPDDGASVTIDESFGLELPHASLSFDGSYTASVSADDPTSAAANNRIELTVDYGNETAVIEASNRVSRSSVQLRTEVSLGTQTVFDQTRRYTR